MSRNLQTIEIEGKQIECEISHPYIGHLCVTPRSKIKKQMSEGKTEGIVVDNGSYGIWTIKWKLCKKEQ